jgi:transcriptional regulator with AAA-type ATPase domain
MQRATQTWDSAEGAEVGSRSPPRLIRFFRADDPLDGVEEFVLSDYPTWTVGRINGWRAVGSPAPLIWSCNDALMSNQHAAVMAVDEGWQIADTSSKNGTFVNGHRIAQSVRLVDGDIVQCGFSFFIYRENEVAERGALPPGVENLEFSPLDYQVDPVVPFAKSDLALHLYGETGTGKEVIARTIHALSGRRGAFVARNCATIPDNLFESELFGYTKGAFSGATASQQGQIPAADGGTLFLDEIGELSLSTQAKLLRVLEDKEVLPLGASTPVPVNFRLVSATLCNLAEMVQEGRFRRDLYARLGRTFHVSPLREHREHLGRLIRTFLVASSDSAIPVPARFKVEAARAIVRYSWPQNVRELKSCIESALTAAMARGVADGSYVIDLDHLPRPVVMGTSEPLTSSARAERLDNRGGVPSVAEAPDNKGAKSDEAVLAALESGGTAREAARILGVTERTIRRRTQQIRRRVTKE